jgi:hypothetical protein
MRVCGPLANDVLTLLGVQVTHHVRLYARGST